MPLTSIRVQNFKSFADSGEILLAPLTVIFGRNNTGKSSILQSLLILRQTLDAPADVARLNLRGPTYGAGVVHLPPVSSALMCATAYLYGFSGKPGRAPAYMGGGAEGAATARRLEHCG